MRLIDADALVEDIKSEIDDDFWLDRQSANDHCHAGWRNLF